MVVVMIGTNNSFFINNNLSISDSSSRYINSVSTIDQFARIFFPLSFATLNLMYFLCYVTFQDDFPGVKNQSM